MLTSQNSIIKKVYFENELNETRKSDSVLSQFRAGLKKLMTILYAKEPSYVRCIKPNYYQKSGLVLF